MRNLLMLCASLAISASGCAEATSSSSPTPNSTIATLNVLSDAPYIVLSANLDEPNGYGFCMDTYVRANLI